MRAVLQIHIFALHFFTVSCDILKEIFSLQTRLHMTGASARRRSSTPEASMSDRCARSEQEWRDCYPLHACAFDNNYGRMQQLLKQGAKSDHQDLHGALFTNFLV